jgi:outer membrane protein
MRTLLITGVVLGILLAPSIVKTQPPLDDYIEMGIKNNLVLQQKNIGLERAMTALKIANGMFSPSVSLLANYTSGDGGRRISIPVGDLMNPVYATLNQLTGSDQFPQIENVNQNFFPRDFYDARVRTSMPILHTDLIYNRKIKAQQTLLQELEVESYKKELIRNIKVAYFQLLASQEIIKIHQAALVRAQESKRVNESLLKNGKGLPAYLIRSESEIETIQAQLLEAEKQAENAKMYFNFLLNREPQEPVITNFNPADALAELPALLRSTPDPVTREEIKQVKMLGSINQDIVKMNSLFWMPRLSGFVDLGAQAENRVYNSQARYYLFGFQLEMPLFAGFTNRHKIHQSQLDLKQNELQQILLNQQFQLTSRQSQNALQTAYQNYLSAQKQMEAAQSYQKLIEKGYREGVNTFIETIDARNQLTSTQLLVTMNQFKVLIARANLEREAGIDKNY